MICLWVVCDLLGCWWFSLDGCFVVYVLGGLGVVVCGCLLLGSLVKLRLIVLVNLFYRFGVVVV